MDHEIRASVGQPLSHKAGRANVIMLNQQGVHGLSLIWILTIGPPAPVVRSRLGPLSFVSKQMVFTRSVGRNEKT